MKKIILFLFCLPLISTAQNFHFSPRIGFAGYHGDLKDKFFTISQSKLLGSLGVRYDLSEHITARSYFTYTALKADDKKGTAAMQQRNLNFRTKILDFELGAQYNFFSLNERWWTPYVFGGIGFYKYNPYTLDQDSNKVFLKPLSTEGQGFLPDSKEYKLTQFSIPFGFGADYLLNEDMRIGLEFGYRKLANDYLDDVSNRYVDESQLFTARGGKAVELAWRGDEIHGGAYPAGGTIRGNPASKDGYYFVALTFTIRYWFDKYKYTSGIPGGTREKRVGCPSTRY